MTKRESLLGKIRDSRVIIRLLNLKRRALMRKKDLTIAWSKTLQSLTQWRQLMMRLYLISNCRVSTSLATQSMFRAQEIGIIGTRSWATMFKRVCIVKEPILSSSRIAKSTKNLIQTIYQDLCAQQRQVNLRITERANWETKRTWVSQLDLLINMTKRSEWNHQRLKNFSLPEKMGKQLIQ